MLGIFILYTGESRGDYSVTALSRFSVTIIKDSYGVWEALAFLLFSASPSYSVRENPFGLRKEKNCFSSSVTFHASHFCSLSVVQIMNSNKQLKVSQPGFDSFSWSGQKELCQELHGAVRGRAASLLRSSSLLNHVGCADALRPESAWESISPLQIFLCRQRRGLGSLWQSAGAALVVISSFFGQPVFFTVEVLVQGVLLCTRQVMCRKTSSSHVTLSL